MEFTLLAGAVGAMLAVAGIINEFVSFLLLLGVIFPPIAAIFVIDAFRSRQTQTAVHWPAIITWLASAGIAILANAGYFTLTTVPALDATLAATLIYWIWSRRFHRTSIRTIHAEDYSVHPSPDLARLHSRGPPDMARAWSRRWGARVSGRGRDSAGPCDMWPGSRHHAGIHDPSNEAIRLEAKDDHVEARVTGEGDVRLINDQAFKPWKTEEGFMKAAVFTAREGRTETRAMLDYEFVPAAPMAMSSRCNSRVSLWPGKK